jgi:hypothetical protein
MTVSYTEILRLLSRFKLYTEIFLLHAGEKPSNISYVFTSNRPVVCNAVVDTWRRRGTWGHVALSSVPVIVTGLWGHKLPRREVCFMWVLHSSGMKRCISWWLVADVSGEHVGPVFKGEAVQDEWHLLNDLYVLLGTALCSSAESKMWAQLRPYFDHIANCFVSIPMQ